jgi:phage terminase small subunit
MSEDVEFGPAMSALNARQRAFVIALVEHPGLTQARAAEMAGYSASSDGLLRKTGCVLAGSPAVQAAIREEAGKRLHAASLIAAGVVVDVMTDESASRTDKLRAAAMVLDRTGFAAAQNINVNKTVTDQSGAAILSRIRALAEKHGLDPQALLGRPAPAMKVIEHQEKSDG